MVMTVTMKSAICLHFMFVFFFISGSFWLDVGCMGDGDGDGMRDGDGGGKVDGIGLQKIDWYYTNSNNNYKSVSAILRIAKDVGCWSNFEAVKRKAFKFIWNFAPYINSFHGIRCFIWGGGVGAFNPMVSFSHRQQLCWGSAFKGFDRTNLPPTPLIISLKPSCSFFHRTDKL